MTGQPLRCVPRYSTVQCPGTYCSTIQFCKVTRYIKETSYCAQVHSAAQGPVFESSTVQYQGIYYSTVQYPGIECIQYNTVTKYRVEYCTVRYSTVDNITVSRFTLQYSKCSEGPRCRVQYSTVYRINLITVQYSIHGKKKLVFSFGHPPFVSGIDIKS